jgi:hypothetical protein
MLDEATNRWNKIYYQRFGQSQYSVRIRFDSREKKQKIRSGFGWKYSENDPKTPLNICFENLFEGLLSNICSSFCRADTGSAAPWQTPLPARAEAATARE